ncbi:MAG: DUF3576 domain-containing protein [Yoonia sp.]|jgi:hypothetical protein|nr:DUF3576 domain-containing protein [Yoonia sp.]
MTNYSRFAKITVTVASLAALSACSSFNPFSALGFGSKSEVTATRQAARVRGAESVAVNRYLWAASIDVLNFLPIESVDPFTGVIVMGYGTPPGGSRAYRATIYITDPALDARSLNVALQSRNGPVSAETHRAIEDAILSRARQIRIADGAL